MTSVVLDFDECVCVQNVADIVDQLIQFVLFERHQIPLPMHALQQLAADQQQQAPTSSAPFHSMAERRQAMQRRRLLQAVDSYADLRAALHCALDEQAAADRVPGAAILLGGTVLTPSDVYSVQFPQCRQLPDSCRRAFGGRELRLINRLCMQQQLSYGFSRLGQTNLFVLLRATADFQLPPAFDRRPHLQLPTSQPSRANLASVQIVHSQCSPHNDTAGFLARVCSMPRTPKRSDVERNVALTSVLSELQLAEQQPPLVWFQYCKPLSFKDLHLALPDSDVL